MKEQLLEVDSPFEVDELGDTLTALQEDDSEFLSLVSRGKMTYPPQQLFIFGLIAYSLFNSFTSLGVTCRKRVIRAIDELYIHLNFYFHDQKLNVFKRLVNSFFKGYVQSRNNKIVLDKKQLTKNKRLKLSHN